MPREHQAKVDELLEQFRTVDDEFRRKFEQVAKWESIYHNFLEFCPVSIIFVNSNNDIIYCNAKTNEMFGYEDGELKNTQVTVLMTAKTRDCYLAAIDEFKRSKVSHATIDMHRCFAMSKNGLLFEVRIIGVAWIDAESGESYYGAAIRPYVET